MSRRVTSVSRRPRRAADHLADLALTAPQVVLHRLGRMAVHGAQPSTRDRAEMQKMVGEKVAAAGESMQALWVGALQATMSAGAEHWLRWMQGGWTQPWWSQRVTAPLAGWQRSADAMTAAALAPLSRRARANLTRLDKAATRRRHATTGWPRR